MMNTFYRIASVTLLGFGVCLSQADAGLQIVGTRVIYLGGEREVTVNIENNGNTSRLLQAWVDDGKSGETANTSRAPFMVTPPVSRVDPGKGQALRVMFTGADLPQDRETVYWFNVLEIPPKPKSTDADSQNFMQLAIRTRIKLFFRPKGLEGSPLDSVEKLNWRLVHQQDGDVIECSNPTPFNVSFGSLELKGTIRPKNALPKGGICPALGKQLFEVQKQAGQSADTVTFSVINDYGGFSVHEAKYQR